MIKAIRPILGPYGCCIYEWSCTDYAIDMLKNNFSFRTILIIARRVISCRFI